MIAPINMDEFHAERIEGTQDVWARTHSSRESAKQFRADRVAASHPVMIRHRRRATVRGFVLHPLVSLGIIAVCLSALVAMGYASGVFS